MAASSCSINYNIFRGTVSGFTPDASNLVVSQAGTAYVDTALTNGTTYYYVVEAVDANGTSPASNQASALASATAVSPLPDFTLAASPASLTLTAGGSGTETVTITPINGFSTTSAVTLTCSGLPGGAACKFAPATVTSTGNIVSTLTVNTSAASASVRHFGSIVSRLDAGDSSVLRGQEEGAWFATNVAIDGKRCYAHFVYRMRRVLFSRASDHRRCAYHVDGYGDCNGWLVAAYGNLFTDGGDIHDAKLLPR